MNMDERDRGYLIRIGEYCERIIEARKRFGDSFETFQNDPDYRDVVCMNIFQIGELSNQLSEQFKESHKEIPWHQIYGIRNILAHAYVKIDNRLIWQTVEADIVKLKSSITDFI